MNLTNGDAPAPVAQEKINTNIVTLTRFLTEEQSKHPEATGDFTYLTTPPPSLPSDAFPSQSLTNTSTIKPPMPRPPILLQINRLLHPPRHPHQPHRPRRLLKHHRRRPKKTRRHRQRPLRRRHAHVREVPPLGLGRGRKMSGI